ncbi:hypothetical protein C7271_06340 [filamentous cyanobacterium CCP5]|nr:hypothetical protein C7271_06340 [filamentous cyanobacterium CCP5]
MDLEKDRPNQVKETIKPHQQIYESQQILYSYFLEAVKAEHPEEVIRYFKTLFFYQVDSTDAPALPALYTLVSSDSKELFHQAIKRICYILINNWHSQRNSAAIAAFFDIFSDPILHRSALSDMLTRLRQWMVEFIQGQDYRELQLYRPDLDNISSSWIQRYTAYLLAAQSHDTSNPDEQRIIAQTQAQQQREKFKFSLAMYTAFSGRLNRRHDNPTALDSQTLTLIRKILVRRGSLDYKYLAKVFLAQSKEVSFSIFKQGFLRYFLFTVQKTPAEDLIQRHLASKLEEIYPHRNPDILDDALLLRAANRIIDACTIDSSGKISPLLREALDRHEVLAPAMILLRTVLVSPYSQAHLDTRIASLIEIYGLEDEADCQDFIRFLEVLRIASTIYLQDVEYNLVSMNKSGDQDALVAQGQANTYRFFSHRQSEPVPSLSS